MCACEKELARALKRFPSTQNGMTESLRNDSETNDATTAGLCASVAMKHFQHTRGCCNKNCNNKPFLFNFFFCHCTWRLGGEVADMRALQLTAATL